MMDGQAAELDMKFQGYIKDTWSPDDSAVAMVKANVTDLPLARGTRSAAAIANDTPVTFSCPSDPEAAPALIKSLLVLTVMPVGLPAVGGPSVTPLRVSTCAPAAKLLSTRIIIEFDCINVPDRALVDPVDDREIQWLVIKLLG